MAKKQPVNTERQKFVSPKIASEVLGVVPQTLRRWAKAGKITAIKLPNGHARYDIDTIMKVMAAANEPKAPAPVERAPDAPKVQTVDPAIEAAKALAAQQSEALAKLMALATQAGAQAKPVPAAVSKPIPTLKPADLKAEIEKIAGRV